MFGGCRDAARSGPFGTTIAHGFLTLSLLPPLCAEFAVPLEGTVMSINYGFDRIRFMTPVKPRPLLVPDTSTNVSDPLSAPSNVLHSKFTALSSGSRIAAALSLNCGGPQAPVVAPESDDEGPDEESEESEDEEDDADIEDAKAAEGEAG